VPSGPRRLRRPRLHLRRRDGRRRGRRGWSVRRIAPERV